MRNITKILTVGTLFLSLYSCAFLELGSIYCSEAQHF